MQKNVHPIYFRSISLENVRCFGERQTIQFIDHKENTCQWNLILGKNGSGKTTVLKSIILASIYDKRHYKEIELNYFQRNADISPEIHFTLGESWETPDTVVYDETEKNSYLAEWDISLSGPQQLIDQLKVFGYGAARIIGETSISKERNGFLASNLFDDSAPLINAEEWLVQQEFLNLKEKSTTQSQNYERVKSILIELLKGEVSEIEVRTEQGTPKAFFKTQFGWVKLHDLSLGYKSLIAWMIDLASRLMRAYPYSETPLKEPAVVLIDELDLHLHPSFQRDLISFLTRTFSKTQFIVTAHSPLIVQAVEKANIILLERFTDSVSVKQNPIDIQNWRTDQVLTSDLFGLSSARSKETERLQKERRNILSKGKLEESDKGRLLDIEKQLGYISYGETEEEMLGLQQMREFAKVLGARKKSKGV